MIYYNNFKLIIYYNNFKLIIYYNNLNLKSYIAIRTSPYNLITTKHLTTTPQK